MPPRFNAPRFNLTALENTKVAISHRHTVIEA